MLLNYSEALARHGILRRALRVAMPLAEVFGPRRNSGARNAVSAAAGYIENEVPQPQLDVAFGFSTMNRAPMIS
jgi:hypothetical protein